MMKGDATVSDFSDLELSITITTTIAEWQKITEQLKGIQPSQDLYDVINRALSRFRADAPK